MGLFPDFQFAVPFLSPLCRLLAPQILGLKLREVLEFGHVFEQLAGSVPPSLAFIGRDTMAFWLRLL